MKDAKRIDLAYLRDNPHLLYIATDLEPKEEELLLATPLRLMEMCLPGAITTSSVLIIRSINIHFPCKRMQSLKTFDHTPIMIPSHKN